MGRALCWWLRRKHREQRETQAQGPLEETWLGSYRGIWPGRASSRQQARELHLDLPWARGVCPRENTKAWSIMFVLGCLPQFVQSWGIGCVGWGGLSSGRGAPVGSAVKILPPLQGWRPSGAPPGDMVSAAEEYWGCEALWWVSSKQCCGISMSFEEIWVNQRELLRVGDSCCFFLEALHLWLQEVLSCLNTSELTPASVPARLLGKETLLLFSSSLAGSFPLLWPQNPLCADHSQMHYLCCRLLKPDVLR